MIIVHEDAEMSRRDFLKGVGSLFGLGALSRAGNAISNASNSISDQTKHLVRKNTKDTITLANASARPQSTMMSRRGFLKKAGKWLGGVFAKASKDDMNRYKKYAKGAKGAIYSMGSTIVGSASGIPTMPFVKEK